MTRLLPFILCMSLVPLALPAMAEQAGAAVAADELQINEHADVLVGRVVIESTAEGEITIAVDRHQGRQGAGDGIAETVYVLQHEGSLILEEDYPLAQVVARPAAVEIHPIPDGRVWMFTLGEAEEFELSSEIGRVAGYGLSQNRGRFPLADAASGEMRSIFGSVLHKSPDSGGTSGGCKSGGPGSSQCSITCSDGTSCGVTCNSGYYACSNCLVGGPSCRCYANS